MYVIAYFIIGTVAWTINNVATIIVYGREYGVHYVINSYVDNAIYLPLSAVVWSVAWPATVPYAIQHMCMRF